MNITVSGHHIEITEPLRMHTQKRFKSLERLNGVNRVEVVLNGEDRARQIAKAQVLDLGKPIHASAEATDMYAAVDLLVDKVKRLVLDHKSKQENRS